MNKHPTGRHPKRPSLVGSGLTQEASQIDRHLKPQQNDKRPSCLHLSKWKPGRICSLYSRHQSCIQWSGKTRWNLSIQVTNELAPSPASAAGSVWSPCPLWCTRPPQRSERRWFWKMSPKETKKLRTKWKISNLHKDPCIQISCPSKRTMNPPGHRWVGSTSGVCGGFHIEPLSTVVMHSDSSTVGTVSVGLGRCLQKKPDSQISEKNKQTNKP